jgi:CheY-like chemotaxis protein
MGGQFEVESEIGRGSLFSFTATLSLRRNVPQESRPPELQDPPVGRQLSGLSILLAEDNAVNRQLALRLLQKQGHQVTCAADGAEALILLEQGVFDLVLMDVEMPNLNGIQTSEAIRAREKETGAHIPIIAMTAHVMKGDEQRRLAAGMDAYPSKPIRPGNLANTIGQTLSNCTKLLKE